MLNFSWSTLISSDASVLSLQAESFQVDEENQANTLVSVAPLPQEPLDKPTANGESPPENGTNPAPTTNGHSQTQTPVADTEMWIMTPSHHLPVLPITHWDTQSRTPSAASKTVHALRQIKHESSPLLFSSRDSEDNNDEAHHYDDDNDNACNVKSLGPLAFAGVKRRLQTLCLALRLISRALTEIC